MSTSFPSRRKSRLALLLFESRLYREGTLAEYWDARDQCKAKGGLGTEECKFAARRARKLKLDFGFLGYEAEVEQSVTLVNQSSSQRRREAMAETQRSRGRTAIEKALDELPDVAPVEQEMAWVRSHPKMTRALTKRLLERGEEYIPPKPNSADISNVKRPCPSRGAWNTLLSALADPKKFNDVLLTRQKDGAVKQASGDTESEGTVMDDLSEVEQMLNAAASRING